LLILIAGAFLASTNSFAGKPEKCSPWPECKDGGGGGGESGVVAPVEILDSDAIGNAITLYWITPITPEGGSVVASYEVRYSETALNDSNFANATLFERDAGISTPARR
jgi:hypothetical protein